MVTVGKPKERGVKSLGAVINMARRCDPLKLRIKSYCKKEKITQAQYADLIGIGKTTVGRFMSGECGVGSECYTRSMVFLKKKMPLSQSDDSLKIKSTFSNYVLAPRPSSTTAGQE